MSPVPEVARRSLHHLPQVPCLCLTTLAARELFIKSNLCPSCCNFIPAPFASEREEAQGTAEVSQGLTGSSGLAGEAGLVDGHQGAASPCLVLPWGSLPVARRKAGSHRHFPKSPECHPCADTSLWAPWEPPSTYK